MPPILNRMPRLLPHLHPTRQTRRHNTMIEQWQKYLDLEPIRRLKNEGRELLGQPIILTEKRDGENVSLWLNENLEPHISSHNLIDASPDIITRFKTTPDYTKAVQLLKDETDFQNHFILYGELLKTVSPTRIEPKRKHVHWILFDIYDLTQKKYLSYNAIYQKAYHYKIPVVRQIDYFIAANMEELDFTIQQTLKWCKRHRREGIVGKDYINQTFFKEKIDLPDKPKLPHKQQLPQYPLMPQERIIRALQHAYDEIGEANWKNVKVAMPIVAKHFNAEAREHCFSVPRQIYQIYLNTPIEQIRGITQ